VERAEPISIGLMPNVRSARSGCCGWLSGSAVVHCNSRSQPVPDIPQILESDMSKILTSAFVALFVTASVPALAQSSGGGSGAGAAGGSGSASGSAGSAGSGTSTAPSANTAGAGASPGTTSGSNQNNSPNPNNAAGTSPAQASRNSGVGTAPNGQPVGSPGSGLGSPEHPIDSRVR
jgi:hypothetical protein